MAWGHLMLTTPKADLNMLRVSFTSTIRIRHSSMSNLAKPWLKAKRAGHVVEHTVQGKKKIQKPKCSYGQPTGENKGPSLQGFRQGLPKCSRPLV